MMRCAITVMVGLFVLSAVCSARAQTEPQVAPPVQADTPDPFAPVTVPPLESRLPYPPPPAYESRIYQTPSEGIRFRMQEVRRERTMLIAQGRPEHWLGRRVGGFTGLGLGAATLGTVLALAAMPGLGPHSGERTYSNGERVGFSVGAVLGAAALGAGLWALATAGSPNPYQERIDALQDEYVELTRDYKQERRREREARRGYSLLPSVSRPQASATRFMLVFSTTL